MSDPTLQEMQEKIKKAGGLFYQYRPCRRDADTIHDIENIQNGVVYGRTPLEMNDPFDSTVGFSVDDLYQDTINLMLSALTTDGDYTRIILSELIKHKACGDLAHFLKALNDLKKHLAEMREKMHLHHASSEEFLARFLKNKHGLMPKEIKDFFPKSIFLTFAMLIEKAGDVEITEETINDLLHVDELLEDFQSLLAEIRDNTFPKSIQEYLSRITISCFSASGWDNQLMWSHYASSYSGMCVEYDFSKMKEFIGFVYEVQYSEQRPTLSLHDIGVRGIDLSAGNKIVMGDVDVRSIIRFLLVKNKCWAYEQEWRIFDVGEPYISKLYNVPFIKSITLGHNIDEICRRLLIDVCKEKDIPCYELVPSVDSFTLDRKLITEEAFDETKETQYISFLTTKLTKKCESINQSCSIFSDSVSDDGTDCNAIAFMDTIREVADFSVHYYYLKHTLYNLPNKMSFDPNEKMDESIKSGIASLEALIPNYMQHIDTFKGLLNGFVLSGRISRSEYKQSSDNLKRIEYLSKKISSLVLHPIFTD